MTLNKIGFLGYPEPDAGVPFAILIEIPSGFLTIVGILNRGVEGFADLESTIIDNQSLEQLKTHFQTEGLQEVLFSHAFWLLERVKKEETPFPEYELIALEERKAKVPSFRKEDYDPMRAMKVSYLMHPKHGAFFALPESILQDGIKGLVLALKNKEEIQQQIIEAVVDSCSEVALDQGLREPWSLALDALSCRYEAVAETEAVQIAQDNRRAMDLKALGSQIPFVRNWVNQQLLNAMAVAQLMAREE